MELVQCAECDRQYDSDTQTFCPRCGATARDDSALPAQQLASKNDPRRRRVQIAGVIMVSTGLLVLAAGIFFVAVAGSAWGFLLTLDDEATAALSQTPSNIAVTILENGMPKENVTLILQTGQGATIGALATNQSGQAMFSQIEALVVNLTVRDGEDEWLLSFVAVNPTRGTDYQLPVTLELSDRSIVGEPLLDENALTQAARLMGFGSIMLGVAPILGGIAAMRLRNQATAIFGAAVGAVPWIFIAFASWSLTVILVIGLYVMSIVFIRQGRDLFYRPNS